MPIVFFKNLLILLVMTCNPAAKTYQRHQPEETTLYQVIQKNINSFFGLLAADPQRSNLPYHVKKEVYEFLKCGILSRGFSRWACQSCGEEKILGFSCKRRGFCPSCSARRGAERTLNLLENVLPDVPMRHWVVSVPFVLRYLMAKDDNILKQVSAIAIHAIAAILRKKGRDLNIMEGLPGAICFLQRAGSDLRLNLHFHILVPDGVFSATVTEMSFQDIKNMTDDDVSWVACRIARQVMKYLKKLGILTDGYEPTLTSDDADTELLPSLQQGSIQNRIVLGERAGQYTRYLGKDFGVEDEKAKVTSPLCVAVNGFSIHAATRIGHDDLEGKKDILDYVSRGPIAHKRISLDADGNILYELKKSFGDKTHALFSPLEFIERIVSIIPPMWQNQVTYWGVLASHSKFRAAVVSMGKPEGNEKTCESAGLPEDRDFGKDQAIANSAPEAVPGPKQPATRSLSKPLTGGPYEDPLGKAKSKHLVDSDDLKIEPKQAKTSSKRSWAELLMAVFKIDIKSCQKCGGRLKFIATITEKVVIEKILTHLGLANAPPSLSPSPIPEYFG